MAEKSISCKSARPTLPHTNPMESGPGNTFRLKIEKTQKIHDFRPKKAPPPPHLPQNLKKVGFKWGGLGESTPKTHWGMCLLDKIMMLQGITQTIQTLGVGYANTPKKAQNGGVCGVFPYARLPGFDLTTSARWLRFLSYIG